MGTVTIETRNFTSSIRVLRLLVLEQDSSDAAGILRELKDSGLEISPCIAGNQLEFKNALSSGEFDAVISARTLSDGEGMEALHILRERRREIPLVLITGESEEKAAAECIKCGAIDYVSKDRMARLPFALRRAVGEYRLSDETTRLRASLRENETHSRELVENSVYGTFRAALDGTFLSANDTLLKILACSSFPEVQALNLSNDVFRYAETFTKLLADSREHTIVHNVETEWRRRDGGFV